MSISLDQIYLYAESYLDGYISRFTSEKHYSLADKRYTVLKHLDSKGYLDADTHTMISNPEFFEALKVGIDDPEEVRVYLNPEPNYAMQHRNIVAILQRLGHIYTLTGDIWRARAFNNAANEIAIYEGPLDYNSLRKLPGIGKSTAGVVEEVATTGRSKRLDELETENVELLSVLDEFESVHGIGPKKAKQFYDQGYRTIKDLEENAKLTPAQELGVKYHDDLSQRIPRSEMDQWKQYFTNFFGVEPENEKYMWDITGSYRRGESSSKDIDIIVRDESPATIVGKLKNAIVGTFAFGPDKFLGLIKMDNGPARRLDIRQFPRDSWAYGLLYNTGSDTFSILARIRAKELGYSLSEWRLVNNTTGQLLPANTEEDIFRHLKVKYLTPRERGHMLARLTPTE